MRCDQKQPACSRCTAKAFDCHYPIRSSSRTASDFLTCDEAPTADRNVRSSPLTGPPDLESRGGTTDSGDALLQGGATIPPFNWEDVGHGSLEWIDSDFDFAEMLSPEKSFDYPSLEVTPSGLASTTCANEQISQPFSLSLQSIPTRPNDTARSLTLRPRFQVEGRRITNLIMQVLKSYPLMMLRHNTLPPFIHPQVKSPNFENSNIEPLDNCINLVGMVGLGGRGSRRLFWRNVRVECERFLADVSLHILASVYKGCSVFTRS